LVVFEVNEIGVILAATDRQQQQATPAATGFTALLRGMFVKPL
jgi:hypothetical protein